MCVNYRGLLALKYRNRILVPIAYEKLHAMIPFLSQIKYNSCAQAVTFIVDTHKTFANRTGFPATDDPQVFEYADVNYRGCTCTHGIRRIAHACQLPVIKQG